MKYNAVPLSVVPSVAAKSGDYTKALDVYASYEEQNVMPRTRTLRYLAKLLQSHDQQVPFDVPSTAQVGIVTCLADHLLLPAFLIITDLIHAGVAFLQSCGKSRTLLLSHIHQFARTSLIFCFVYKIHSVKIAIILCRTKVSHA